MSSKKDEVALVTAQRAMKGWTPVTAPAVRRDSVSRPAADVVMPSSADLKAKYLGSAAPSDVGVRLDSLPGVQPRDPGHTQTITLESHGIRKSVGVSEGKVIWRQG